MKKSANDYVLGFIFDETRKLVLMIKKNDRTWQSGLLNGVGGKVEPSDPTLFHAMSREASEESGLNINISDWNSAGVLRGLGWNVNVFYTTVSDVFEANLGETEEGELLVRSTRQIILDREPCVYHVSTLLHMCLKQKEGQDCHFELVYNETDRAEENES